MCLFHGVLGKHLEGCQEGPEILTRKDKKGSLHTFFETNPAWIGFRLVFHMLRSLFCEEWVLLWVLWLCVQCLCSLKDRIQRGTPALEDELLMSLPTQFNISNPVPPHPTLSFCIFLHSLCHLLTQLSISHLPPLECKFQESKDLRHFVDEPLGIRTHLAYSQNSVNNILPPLLGDQLFVLKRINNGEAFVLPCLSNCNSRWW